MHPDLLPGQKSFGPHVVQVYNLNNGLTNHEPLHESAHSATLACEEAAAKLPDGSYQFALYFPRSRVIQFREVEVTTKPTVTVGKPTKSYPS